MIKLTKDLPTESGRYYWASRPGGDVEIVTVEYDCFLVLSADIQSDSTLGGVISRIGGYWAKIDNSIFTFEDVFEVDSIYNEVGGVVPQPQFITEFLNDFKKELGLEEDREVMLGDKSISITSDVAVSKPYGSINFGSALIHGGGGGASGCIAPEAKKLPEFEFSVAEGGYLDIDEVNRLASEKLGIDGAQDGRDYTLRCTVAEPGIVKIKNSCPDDDTDLMDSIRSAARRCGG